MLLSSDMYGQSPVQSLYTTPESLSANAPKQNTLAMELLSSSWIRWGGGPMVRSSTLLLCCGWFRLGMVWSSTHCGLGRSGYTWVVVVGFVVWVLQIPYKYFEFPCAVASFVLLRWLDWWRDTFILSARSGAGHPWGTQHWLPWWGMQWAGCISFGVQI